MNKAHSRVNWENYPSDSTPLNERNLNKMDVSIDEIDNRVISLDTTKLDKVTAATMVKDVSYDESTGIFTVKYLNGATYTLDTKLEKLVVNFSYNATTQQLIITLDDGTIQYVDLAALITQYEFLDTDTVAFYVDSTGKVSAIVKDGSITEDKLQPNYLADIKIEVSKAQNSATAAATSEKNAKASETAAKESETNAKASETAAKTSETNAKASETAAKSSETNAAQSETNAKNSEDNAKTLETNAANSATSAEKSAANAAKSEKAAEDSAASAETSADLAKSYSVGTDGEVRENDGTDNAKYYYEQAKHISQGMNGLTPMGTVAFENLPTDDIVKNAMYNISNAFTSDDRFLDGGGITYGAGNNVYYTVDGKWDVLASSAVTGVKGDKESTYRQGNVNITSDDIGALPVDGDSKDNTVSFAENTELENISSGENHKTLFGKISKAIRTLISHVNTKAITNIQNLHPLGHVQVYDEKQDITTTNQCSVPSMYLFQDEIDTLNTNLVPLFIGFTQTDAMKNLFQINIWSIIKTGNVLKLYLNVTVKMDCDNSWAICELTNLLRNISSEQYFEIRKDNSSYSIIGVFNSENVVSTLNGVSKGDVLICDTVLIL